MECDIKKSERHQRIASRFDAMLNHPDQGLIAEVKALRARSDLHPNLPSIRCVGYRQTWEYLDGTIDLPTLREKAVAATRQLAKRQLTWLRSMPDRIVIDCLDAQANSMVRKHVEEAIGRAKEMKN